MKNLAVLFLAILLGLAAAAPAVAAVAPPPAAAVKPAPAKIVQRPVFNVSGTVQGEDGKGIAGVVVTIGTLTATSGADGAYAVAAVPAGSHTLSAAKPGYAAYAASLGVTAAVVKNITLTGAYTLGGYVRDPSGAPVAGAVVALDDKQGTAGANGHYSVSGLTVGKKVVNVYPSAQERAAGQAAIRGLLFDVTGNMAKDWTISIPGTWTLKGYIRDAASGVPVAGATVTVDGRQTATSKTDGSYSVSGIRHDFGPSNQGFAVTVSKAGYNIRQDTVRESNPNRDFGLVPR